MRRFSSRTHPMLAEAAGKTNSLPFQRENKPHYSVVEPVDLIAIATTTTTHRRTFHHQRSSMSKKNKKSTRVKQHVFDLKREKEDQEKKAKKAEKQKVKVEQKKIKAENSMKVDSGISKAGKQIKKKSFKVGKTRKFQHDATTKAKAAQAMAMEIEK